MVKVSVVMPVYNGEDYLEECVESVLGQSLKDFEFIIINDASTDRTAEMLKRFAKQDKRIRIIANEKNSGMYASLNRALKLAKGRYIARMDHDDVSEPKRLQKQAGFLDKNPEVALVGTWATIIDKNGKVLGKRALKSTHDDIVRFMVKKTQFVSPSVMFRKSVIAEVGSYDVKRGLSQEYEFFMKIIGKHKVANIPEYLLRHRFCFSNYYGKKQKRQEWNSLRIRYRGITQYGFPKWQSAYLIKPFVSYLVPIAVKKPILRTLYWISGRKHRRH